MRPSFLEVVCCQHRQITLSIHTRLRTAARILMIMRRYQRGKIKAEDTGFLGGGPEGDEVLKDEAGISLSVHTFICTSPYYFWAAAMYPNSVLQNHNLDKHMDGQTHLTFPLSPDKTFPGPLPRSLPCFNASSAK